MCGSNHPKSSTSLLSYSTLRKSNLKQLFQDLEKTVCIKMYSYNGKVTYCCLIPVSLFSLKCVYLCPTEYSFNPTVYSFDPTVNLGI